MYLTNSAKFNEIDHTADIGLRAEGDTRSELFANLAFGMMHIIAGEVNQRPVSNLKIEIRENSEADLIVSWLSEINYHLNVHHFLPIVINEIIFQSRNDGLFLKANLDGINILDNKIELKTEIKAVTYHKLLFEKTDHGCIGQVIFDI